MQNEITVPSKLLDNKGELIQKGYATSPILMYQRKNVAKKHRLKEWDYYLIYNENYGVALTLGKSGSLVLISASLINYNSREQTTKSLVRFVSKRKLSMPESSKSGDIHYQDKELNLSFKHRNGHRELTLFMRDFKKNKNLEVAVKLFDEPKDSMVIATPFKESKKYFYYNQKIIGMRAEGSVYLDQETILFKPDTSFGLLDWGRGAWPYKTSWYWGAGQGIISGNLFGFNLGYGFGDTSAATENMIFFNGKASKLKNVVFHIPKNEKNQYEYLKPWMISSSDKRFEMVFKPILDRSANLSLIFFSTNQHQVFGKYTGTVMLDDGTIIFLKDFLGFAERVKNRW